MVDVGRWQPAVDESFHSFPVHTPCLAPASKHPVPVRAHSKTKAGQGIAITRYSVVANMPAHDRLQPLADFWNRVMHPPPQFGFHFPQPGLHPFTNRVPNHRKPSPLGCPADMRESEKVEGFRLSLAASLSVLRRMTAKLQEPGLFRVQFQTELFHALFQFVPEPFGFRFVLESNQSIIGKSHDDDIALSLLLPPCLNPEIKDVMEVSVCQQRRNTPALW